MAFERTRANLKKYTKYSINLTFRLQKSTYMWYNVIKYSIYKVKKEQTMIAIVCIENSNGVLFNKRRVSQDKAVTEKILEITSKSKLWMDSYSFPLFEQYSTANINIADNFLCETSKDEYCFVENKLLKPYEKWLDKIIVFKWNRDYPSDFKFDLDLTQWKLTESTEFVGNSHKNITMEVYVR